MEVKFTKQDIEVKSTVSVNIDKVVIERLVDNKDKSKIIAFISNFGRITLFEEDDYPANGIHDKSKAQIEVAIKAAIGVV